MNPETPEKAEDIFSWIKKSSDSPEVEKIIFPPAIYIPLFKDRGINLGVQNIHTKEKGAFTGEISAKMAVSSGCKYVLVGHSERRKLFGEKNKVIREKIKIAFQEGLTPILCIGETEEEKNEGLTGKVIKTQLKECLKGIGLDKKIIIGYEPVWAIGSGNSCDPEDAFKMKLLIKKTICHLFNREIADRTAIVYGGSVNLGNCKKYIEEAKFDGLLVGGASLRPQEFSKMIREM